LCLRRTRDHGDAVKLYVTGWPLEMEEVRHLYSLVVLHSPRQDRIAPTQFDKLNLKLY
jgi:hypothetical protein